MKNKLVKKSNFDRALITDTHPFDVPIIFNNEGLYSNTLNKDSKYISIVIKKLISNTPFYTNPIDYNISKGDGSIRRLSLPHPAVQQEMCRFYEEYSDLICYYTSRSPISIRAPLKQASTFYTGEGSSESKYKGDNIESLLTDFKNKHSISFFKYNGFNRIYKFFSSGKFYSLEKEYEHFWCMDVSKCFESIYTHSMSWANKTKDFIKFENNVKIDAMFGQKIDKLMQRSNRNETNGILVGPEFSRIFAEIILQTVDINTIKRLDKKGIKYGLDYNACRYIDDIFIFSKNENISSLVFNCFSDELRKFNLHVNEHKTRKYQRPFITRKSLTTNKINDEINRLSESMFSINNGAVNLADVRSHFNVSNRFIDRVKTICADTGSSYADVSNYIISSLEQRVRKLFSFYEVENESNSIIRIDDDNQFKIYKIVMVFLEAIFHLYTISNSVSSSYVVSRCCLVVTSFFDKQFSDYSTSIRDFIFLQVVNYSKVFSKSSRDQHLSLELINLILITSEFGYEFQFSEAFLKEHFFDLDNGLAYFNTISLIYYIKNYPKYKNLHSEFLKILNKKINAASSFATNSDELHLILDLIACPYISIENRVKWVKHLSDIEKLEIDTIDHRQVVLDFEQNPWFVDWKSINLYNLLEKKLLKSIY
ncbi:antiviral reverse transcriptase Drt3b [Vibrio sp. VNB-15]